MVLKHLMAATGAASILALLEMPYDFYALLRGLVSISALLLALFAVLNNNPVWILFAVPAFVLWFPIFGFTLARESWAVINLLAAMVFLYAWKNFDFSERA